MGCLPALSAALSGLVACLHDGGECVAIGVRQALALPALAAKTPGNTDHGRGVLQQELHNVVEVQVDR